MTTVDAHKAQPGPATPAEPDDHGWICRTCLCPQLVMLRHAMCRTSLHTGHVPQIS
jgi:hypothetical protein